MKQAHGVAIVVLSGVGLMFALAIRGDRRGDVQLDPKTAARDAMRANLDRARAARDASGALAKQLAGSSPGAPGPLLAGVRFGALGASAPPDVVARIRGALGGDGTFAIDPATGTATATVSPAVLEGVHEIWGQPADGVTWTDDRDGVIVVLGSAADPDHVTLTWRPFETLARMVAPGDFIGATPFSIVGARADDVKALLGARLADGVWTLPPMRDDLSGPAPVASVVIEADVVTRVDFATDDSAEPAFDALHAAYGEPARGPWRMGRVTIEADGHPDGALVSASLAK